MKCSVVIPNYNGRQFLTDCLTALSKQTYSDFEIILVDNGSADDSISLAKSLCPDIVIVDMGSNTGFAPAVNAGIKHSNAEYVILLNNDTIVFPSFIENHIKMMEKKPHVFSSSAMMIRNDKRDLIDDAGDFYCALGWAFAPSKDKKLEMYSVPYECFAACGGAAIYRRAIFEKIGYFDDNFFAYLEDIDIGYRAKLAGYKNIYNPHARVYHIGSGSSGSRYNDFKIRLAARNSMYLVRKNMPAWQVILNFPFLLAGVLIKWAFFAKKGFGKVYISSIFEGLKNTDKIKKSAGTGNFKNCLKIQKMLYIGLKQRLS